MLGLEEVPGKRIAKRRERNDSAPCEFRRRNDLSSMISRRTRGLLEAVVTSPNEWEELLDNRGRREQGIEDSLKLLTRKTIVKEKD